jgi:predicted phage tail protein
VNGKRVSAGITLGSNGETSDIIMYADRFSLFNRNNKATVPVMIAEGNELYIDSARIKTALLILQNQGCDHHQRQDCRSAEFSQL